MEKEIDLEECSKRAVVELLGSMEIIYTVLLSQVYLKGKYREPNTVALKSFRNLIEARDFLYKIHLQGNSQLTNEGDRLTTDPNEESYLVYCIDWSDLS